MHNAEREIDVAISILSSLPPKQCFEKKVDQHRTLNIPLLFLNVTVMTRNNMFLSLAESYKESEKTQLL